MGRHSLSAGRLRHQITIQSATNTDDGAGGVTQTWGTYATAYAAVEPASSREGYAAGQLQGEITHTVTLRYVSGVTTAMRVSFDSGRLLRIVGRRTIDEAGRYMELDAIEEQS